MSSTIQFILGLIPELINHGGKTKTLYCSCCKEYRDQVSVPYADWIRIHEHKGSGYSFNYPEWVKSAVTSSSSILVDLNPISGLTIGSPYVCKTCGHMRMQGGVMSEAINSDNKKDPKTKNYWQ